MLVISIVILLIIINNVQCIDVRLDSTKEDIYVLNNNYIEITIDNTLNTPYISSVRSDYYGSNNYNNNLLSNNGIRLEREDDTNMIDNYKNNNITISYSNNNDNCGVIEINDVVDNTENPLASESWVITLCPNQRSFDFQTTGRILSSSTVKAIHHSFDFAVSSVTAFFDNGVVQMMNADDSRAFFGSNDNLQRVYYLGDGGSIDITFSDTDHQSVLLSSNTDSNEYSFRTGYQDILAGQYDPTMLDYWNEGWKAQSGNSNIDSTMFWNRKYSIAVNNYNFPVSTVSDATVINMDGNPEGDLGAFLTGIYGNAVGCLCTYNNEVEMNTRVAQIATSLRTDNSRGYNGTYNYFDPDNFFGISAILYSGDPYLLNQARMVIERTGSFIKEDTGQLPHHFDGTEPYYLALSGETQTGPNIFWTKTALQYASESGDFEWLRNYLPTLRLSSNFVFDLIEEDTSLLFAPGSLMIDVFIRNNYTSDSNAMVVGFLRDFAAAERLVGDAGRADELLATAERVSTAMNEKLWAVDGDHFITQLNTDGTIRDFIDYDANLIAVANNVADEDRARKIFTRIDGGRCSAASGAGAQFVSEVYYGPDDTTNGNTGDSWCSMGRIAWFDSLSRKRFATADDESYFLNTVLKPIQSDLIEYTWMHERYGCDGKQQENRTMYYFEYPSLVSMLLKDIKYGISLHLNSIEVKPFGLPQEQLSVGFLFHTGVVRVAYSQQEVAISLPIDAYSRGSYQYSVSHLIAGDYYRLSIRPSLGSTDERCPLFDNSNSLFVDRYVRVDIDTGDLNFAAPAVPAPCELAITHIGRNTPDN